MRIERQTPDQKPWYLRCHGCGAEADHGTVVEDLGARWMRFCDSCLDALRTWNPNPDPQVAEEPEPRGEVITVEKLSDLKRALEEYAGKYVVIRRPDGNHLVTACPRAWGRDEDGQIYVDAETAATRTYMIHKGTTIEELRG